MKSHRTGISLSILVAEGMAMTVDIMNEFRWGRDFQRCVKALSPYGGAARDLLPRLRETRQTLAGQDKNWEKKDNERREAILALDKLIPAIEADRNPPAVQTMDDFIRTAGKGK